MTRSLFARVCPRCVALERGQALVEFALVSALLVLMLMGVFDLGRAIGAQASLSHAVHEAANLALLGVDTPEQEQAVRDVVCQQATLAPDLACGGSGNVTVVTGGSPRTATISASYEFAPVTPLVQSLMPGGRVTLNASVMVVVP